MSQTQEPTEHIAGTTSRHIPEDVRKYHFRHGYVVTLCNGKHEAEAAAQTLVDDGFQREELVLVSHDVDALNAGWPGEDDLEVQNPASISLPTSSFAGGTLGVFAGALTGLTVTFLTRHEPSEFWAWVFPGGLLGILIGGLLGFLGYSLLARKPMKFYDSHELSGDQVLVGIGLGSKGESARLNKARRVLEAQGRTVLGLPE